MAEIKHKGIRFNMAGQVLVIPSITFAELESLKVKIKNFSDDLSDPACIAAMIDAIHSAIKRNYPEITRETVADGIDFENMEELLDIVMDIHGSKRKQIAAKMRRLNS